LAAEALAVAALGAAICACDRGAHSAVSSLEVPVGEVQSVQSFGELRKIMHQGQTGPVFRVRDANAAPHAFAIGALSGLRGEVTILDGETWLAYPDGAHARVLRDPGTSEEATLFVLARVPAWRAVGVAARVPFDRLDDFIEETAAASGIDVSKPFPVRIEGPLVFARWHVVDGSRMGTGDSSHADHVRTAVTGRLEGVDAQLVGFFARSAQGVYTHVGQRTHFHLIDRASDTMGHVDEVEIGAGARVLFAGGTAT
jgi:acetolactate decarboxylase